MFYKFVLLAVTFLFTVSAVNAQSNLLSVRNESRRYGQWHDKDVVYIITEEEKKAYLGLTTDEEREKFKEDFWLRRDPHPDTEANEYREEFYERVSYANQNFNSGIPGWKTDRGRIYILFGKPDEIIRDYGTFEGANEEPMIYERWHYKSISSVGNDIKITFIDPTETNEYRFPKEEKETVLKLIKKLRNPVCRGCPMEINVKKN